MSSSIGRYLRQCRSSTRAKHLRGDSRVESFPDPTVEEEEILQEMPDKIRCFECTDLDQAEESRLCHVCRGLRHCWTCFRLFGTARDAVLNIGTVATIRRRRQCVLCSLMLSSILTHTRPLTNESTAGLETADVMLFSVNDRLNEEMKLRLRSAQLRISMVIAVDCSKHRAPTKRVLEPQKGMIHPKIGITPKQAKLGPLIGSTVNWIQLREWLQDCTTKHEDCACIAGKGVPEGFRLIDVRRRCLTPELDQDTHISYAALSYVWGSDPDNGKLKGHMVERLESPGSLDDIPKTIEDALIICSELGYQYLWADRLCVIQDDFEKKQGQINSMAQIFSLAAVTIVTAACKDMDSPVPGVSLERSKGQRQVQIADLHFTSTLPNFEMAVESTVWATRGWTYQEDVLSSRKLVFLDSEVWYECHDGLQREGLYSSNTQPLVLRNGSQETMESTRLRDKFSSHPLRSLGRHLGAYSERSLTYQSDIYDAFSGITRALYPDSLISYGLPHDDFCGAMLWRIKEGRSQPRLRPHGAADYSVSIPSWSWASVLGRVVCCWESPDMICPLVEWFKGHPKASSTRILSSTMPKYWADWEWLFLDSHTVIAKCPQFYLAIAWSYGCIDAPPVNVLDKNNSFNDLKTNKTLWKRWPRMERFWEEVDSHRHTQSDLWAHGSFPPEVIRCRAQTALFSLRPHHEHPGCLDRHWLEIVDPSGVAVGRVDGVELKLRSEGDVGLENPEARYEFMAISISEKERDEMCEEWKREGKNLRASDTSFWDELGGHLWPRSMVDVLLIQWREDSPFARRMSICWIFLKKWVQQERTWKEVALE